MRSRILGRKFLQCPRYGIKLLLKLLPVFSCYFSIILSFGPSALKKKFSLWNLMEVSDELSYKTNKPNKNIENTNTLTKPINSTG